jgi:competence protein ComEC
MTPPWLLECGSAFVPRIRTRRIHYFATASAYVFPPNFIFLTTTEILEASISARTWPITALQFRDPRRSRASKCFPASPEAASSVGARIHRSVIEKIHMPWPAREAGLIDAMVIGEDAFLKRATRTDFQKSGTYHVLVVSGMNVGILAFSPLWFLRRLRINDMAASALTIFLCLAYASLTDVGAPIWRATLMLVLYLGARAFYRQGSILNTLGAAAFGLLVLDPKALLSASFQLTFLCVLLIASAGAPLLERLSQTYLRGLRNFSAVSYDWVLPPKVAQFRRELRMLAKPLSRLLGRTASMALPGGARVILGGFELLFVSSLMQIGLALPMAYYFYRVTSLGLVANLLVIPLTDVLMPAAIVALGLGYLSSALAAVPAWIASVALD